MLTNLKRILLSAAFILFALPLSVLAQEEDGGPSVPPSPQLAAPTYADRCANCHGPTGQGDGPQAVQANLPVPDLTDPDISRQTTPARWFDIISNGVAGKAMPPFGEASSSPLRQIDRWNLVFYLYTLGTPPEQVAMGQALYEQNCAACHGANGAGIDDAPGFIDLDGMVQTSQTDLFAAIADTAIQGHDLGLGEVEIWAVADYARTFSYEYVPPPAPAESTSAVASPFAGGAGVVSGRVINGTAGAPPPAGLPVRLRAFDMNADFIDVITTTVAADGTFRFTGIDPEAPVQLEPLVVYQDIPYFGNLDAAIILSPSQPEADVDITVYETTADPAAVRIERLHLVFDFASGQVQVAELYIFSNDGDRAYVGTVEAGTVPLTVPPNALGFRPGGDPNRYLTLADGVADTAPIPPGENTAESVLVYELAYDDELSLSRPMPFDARAVNIFAPDVGVQVSGEGIQPGGPFQTQDVSLQTYLVDDLSAGDRLTLRLSGEPEVAGAPVGPSPHDPSGPSDAQSVAIGAIILAAALAFAVLYWQGHLNLRWRLAAQDRRSTLLQSLADLDDDFDAGKIQERSYLRQRAAVKEKLIRLMEEES